MKQLTVKTLIIGATFFGTGFALNNPNSLIIDKASRPGYEYMDAFDNRFEPIQTKLAPQAAWLLAQFEERKILSPQCPPLLQAYASMLSKVIKDNGLKLLFRTVIIHVDKKDGGYEVLLTTPSGLCKVCCQRIVDTTDRNSSSKTLNALLIRNGMTEKATSHYRLVAGDNENLLYLRLCVPCDATLQQARKALYDLAHSGELGAALLVQTAYEFSHNYEAPTTSSASYQNPILAFNAGLLYDGNEDYTFSNKVIKENYDVVVCGLGTAGAIAAITSGENSVSTLGLETEALIGGIPTAGQVLGYYYGAPGGRFEITDQKTYENTDFARANKIFYERILPDARVEVMEQEAEAAAVSLKYRAYVYEVIKEDNRVVGLKYICNHQLYEVTCKYVIDATGEADICTMAGAQTLRGRAIDGKTQPFSLCTMTVTNGGVESYYCDNGYINANDVTAYTDTAINTYLQKMFLKDSYDRNTFFSVIAPMVGIREGRHIKAIKNVSFQDYLDGFPGVKPLFYAYSSMDTHSSEHAFEDDVYIEWSVVSRLRKLNFFVPVSIENLIPDGLEGILAAGKGIGVDHDISPCVRMKKDMSKCGEACGKLVSLAVRDNCTPLEVSYEELKESLTKSGCFDEANKLTTFQTGKLADGTKVCADVEWYDNIDTIHEKMSDQLFSSVAIHSAVRLGIRDKLKEWLKEDIGYNAALALGLLGDKAALPLIRERVTSHPLMDSSDRRDELLLDTSAIYLAAKLEDKESVENIVEIFELSNGNALRNQYLFFAAHALRKFYKVGFLTKERYDRLIDSLSNVRICLSPVEDIYEDITEQVKNYMRA